MIRKTGKNYKMDQYQAAPGKIVMVNGHKMHVFVQRTKTYKKGETVFIFMAGSGTWCPTLDFKPLWSLMDAKYTIAVLERAGYGWSEVTEEPRDLDTMLDESRQALIRAGINPPYILVPHSMSSIEALYWTQMYPKEVKGIVGLDFAVPDIYDTFKMPIAPVVKLLQFLIRRGVHKLFASVICKKMSVVQSGVLSGEDCKQYREIFCGRLLTINMINEGRLVKVNAQRVRKIPVDATLPILFFISSGKGMPVHNWREVLLTYLAQYDKGTYVLLDCGHYVHTYESKKMIQDIDLWVKEYGLV